MTREANNATAIAKVFGFMERPPEPAKLISSFWRGRTRVGWTMGAAVEQSPSRKSLGEAAVLATRGMTGVEDNGPQRSGRLSGGSRALAGLPEPFADFGVHWMQFSIDIKEAGFAYS